MVLRRAAIAILILGMLGLSAAEPANLTCKIGPIEKTYGGTKWNVYGCDDKRSVVIVTAPGNPAMPFYFIFFRKSGRYQLHGEGTGDKKITDAAYKELAALKESDIATLVAEAGRR